ncbi:MAG: BCCT family transporter, partial [Halomonadaceae bacterium]
TAFGGNGLEQAQNEIGVLKDGIVGDSSMALFHMLDQLPLANLTAFLAIVLVLVFFVTSSDSGSLVIDSITAGGKLDSPQAQRVFWVVIESLIAGALLFGGGDNALYALQAAAIIVGLPFTIVLLFMCVSLYMGLSQENRLLKQGATQTGGAGSS